MQEEARETFMKIMDEVIAVYNSVEQVTEQGEALESDVAKSNPTKPVSENPTKAVSVEKPRVNPEDIPPPDVTPVTTINTLNNQQQKVIDESNESNLGARKEEYSKKLTDRILHD
jgi:hypothetical protein